MRTVDHDADELVGAGRIERLPGRVQDALGELAGAAREGLLALSVGVGLGVLHELMEAEVDEVVGPKGRHDPGRAAVRHGHDGGEVTLATAIRPSGSTCCPRRCAAATRLPAGQPTAWSPGGFNPTRSAPTATCSSAAS